MRLPAALALLVAAGCSSESPAPTDAQVLPDVASGEDRPGTDAVAVPDAPAVDAADAVVVDARADAVAVPDVIDAAGDVVDASSTADSDVPELADVVLADVVDVAQGDVVDAGPADAGPQTFPLDPPPAVTEARVLFDRICRDGTRCGDPLTVASAAACTRTGTSLSVSVRACTVGSSPTCFSVTGLFPMAPATTSATVTLVAEGADQGTDLGLRVGAVSGGRQSVHVQFRVPYTAGRGGFTGVEGRTVDPARGDLWFLGCAVR